MLLLELWMIVVLLLVFGYALYDMYHRGFGRGFLEGGLYSYAFTMKAVRKVANKEQLDTIEQYMKDQSERD